MPSREFHQARPMEFWFLQRSARPDHRQTGPDENLPLTIPRMNLWRSGIWRISLGHGRGDEANHLCRRPEIESL